MHASFSYQKSKMRRMRAADKIVAGPTGPYKAHATGRRQRFELDSDDTSDDTAFSFLFFFFTIHN